MIEPEQLSREGGCGGFFSCAEASANLIVRRIERKIKKREDDPN
jgi:hypothetical protein